MEMVMKALKKVLMGLGLCAMFLLAACSQNAVPEETLEPEGLSRLTISGIQPTTVMQDICRRHAPLCDMADESFFFSVKVDPVCTKAICNNPTDILVEGTYRFDLMMPEVTLTASQFAQSFKLDMVDANGKVVATGLASTKLPVLEFSAKLPKGKYALRVQVLNKAVATLMQTSPDKYPLSFLVGTMK
jgi:hypothetical protein